MKGLLKEYAKQRAQEYYGKNNPNVKPGDPYPFEGKTTIHRVCNNGKILVMVIEILEHHMTQQLHLMIMNIWIVCGVVRQ